jgi:hypothetical protein
MWTAGTAPSVMEPIDSIASESTVQQANLFIEAQS